MAIAISRAVIEILLDRVQQGAATVSAEGTISYANQRLASMLGAARMQLVGKPLAGLAAEADRDALAEALAAGRDTASQCRVALARPGGRGEVQAFLTFAPLGHGQSSCLVTDTQDRHIGVLAQEVRTMVGAVRNSLELLKGSALDESGRHAVDAMERQTGRMLDLVEDLRRATPRE